MKSDEVILSQFELVVRARSPSELILIIIPIIHHVMQKKKKKKTVHVETRQASANLATVTS
jgi:hypothetical protein